LSYLANTQTDRQTNSGKNITSLAEVNMSQGIFYVQNHELDSCCDKFTASDYCS